MRKGTALKTLKDTDKAREAFEYVIKNYPDTTRQRPWRSSACSSSRHAETVTFEFREGTFAWAASTR